MLAQAAFAGLLSVGNPPVDLGLVPLPALMFAVREARRPGRHLHLRSGRQARLERPALHRPRRQRAAHQPGRRADRPLPPGGLRAGAGRRTSRRSAATAARSRATAPPCWRRSTSPPSPPAASGWWSTPAEGPAAPATAAAAAGPGLRGPDQPHPGAGALAKAVRELHADVGLRAGRRRRSAGPGRRAGRAAGRGRHRGDRRRSLAGPPPRPGGGERPTSHMVEAAAARHGATVARTPVRREPGARSDARAGRAGGRGGRRRRHPRCPSTPAATASWRWPWCWRRWPRAAAPLSERFPYLRSQALLRDTLALPGPRGGPRPALAAAGLSRAPPSISPTA